MQSYQEGKQIYNAIKSGERKQYAHKSTRLEIEAYKKGFEAGFGKGFKLGRKEPYRSC